MTGQTSESKKLGPIGLHWTVELAIRVIVVVGFILFAVDYTTQRARDTRQDACLSSYADDSAKVQKARAEAAAQDREADRLTTNADRSEIAATRAIIEAVASQNEEAIRSAFVAALEAAKQAEATRTTAQEKRDKNEEIRRANPIPESPELRCHKG